MGDIFNEGLKEENPVHKVCVSNFSIGKYEVSQALWKEVMGDNPSEFKGDNNPVDNVSWDDVQGFIKKLNEKTGMTYRLPTEAQWEYACRGGGKNVRYSGTNIKEELSFYAWYSDNSVNGTHAIGQKRPNELGIYDMTGNVWEWVMDVYNQNAYAVHRGNNPVYEAAGIYRVNRGGSWYDEPQAVSCSFRDLGTQGDRVSNVGFRIVSTPERVPANHWEMKGLLEK